MNCCRVCLIDLNKQSKDTVKCESCSFIICYDCDYSANHFGFTPDSKIICKLCESIAKMKTHIQSR